MLHAAKLSHGGGGGIAVPASAVGDHDDEDTISLFLQHAAVGLIISVLLSAICLWRLLIFIVALLRTEQRKASARRASSG